MFNELIISYLFLGGMGAGSFVVLSLAWAFSSRMALAGRGSSPMLPEGYRSFLAIGFGVSLAVQCLGVLCLLVDLERPRALPYLLLAPHFSAVAVGAYALAMLALCSLAIVFSRLGIVRIPRRAEGLFALTGSVVSCVVMAYTALILRSCVGISFWRSWLILPLFVISSLSTGAALVVLTSFLSRGFAFSKTLVRGVMLVDFFLIVLELLFLAGFVAYGFLWSEDSRPYELLLFGPLSEVFWLGLVGLGLVLPASLGVCSCRFTMVRVNPMLVSLLVMLGGVCLRCCIVGAGTL